jgi:hypothetical protein
MTDSHETSHDQSAAIHDPHFTQLAALSHLSKEALRGVINVLEAKEHARQTETDTTPAGEPNQETLLNYIQNPEATQD